MKRLSFLMAVALIGVIASINIKEANAGDKCNVGIREYKKRFLVSGCKSKEGDICFVRCDQPNFPEISI